MSEPEENSPVHYEPVVTRPTPRPSHVDVLKHLECTICYDFLEPPVIRCSNDHLYCKKCLKVLNRLKLSLNCPQCSVIINLDNEDSIALELLNNVSLPCEFCFEEYPLSMLRKHMNGCLGSPDQVSCIFKKIGQFNCKWKGHPQRLMKHLMKVHDVKSLELNTTVNYMWDVPDQEKIRIRPRIFRVDYPSGTDNFSYFLLEHIFKPEFKQLTFVIKSFRKDVKLDYTLLLKDKKNERTWASFTRQTEYLSGPVLSRYPRCDKTNIVQVDFDHIIQISYPYDGTEYYSFAIIFHTD